MQLTKTECASDGRIRQGDILRDVEWLEHVTEQSGQVEIVRVVFPLAIVLTQDCDLKQEHDARQEKDATNQDKWLVSVLLAPLYNADHVYVGEHLSELGIRMEPIKKNKSPGTNLRNNERPRYHYLEFEDGVPLVPSVVDFKHYFSVTVRYLLGAKTTSYVCSVAPIFREDIAHRFAGYLSRVGLPGPDASAPVVAGGNQ